MALAPIKTQGTTMTFMDSESTPAAQDILGHKTISDFESGEASEIDITTLTSPAVERMLGLVDNGAFALTCITDLADPGQAAMDAARLSGASKEMVITLVSGDVATFNALVQSAPKSADINGVWQTVYNILIDGAITWT